MYTLHLLVIFKWGQHVSSSHGPAHGMNIIGPHILEGFCTKKSQSFKEWMHEKIRETMVLNACLSSNQIRSEN